MTKKRTKWTPGRFAGLPNKKYKCSYCRRARAQKHKLNTHTHTHTRLSFSPWRHDSETWLTPTASLIFMHRLFSIIPSNWDWSNIGCPVEIYKLHSVCGSTWLKGVACNLQSQYLNKVTYNMWLYGDCTTNIINNINTHNWFHAIKDVKQ